MVAGPAALAVALLLLPGWVYWRLEGSPRTARSALAEFFEVVAAGAAVTGIAILVYISLPNSVRGLKVGEFLVDPEDLSGQYVRQQFSSVAWSLATLVFGACLLAVAIAKTQKGWRRIRKKDKSTYFPLTPIWVSILDDTEESVIVDLRDGRRFTGYLGGHSVDDDGAPTINLAPPVILRSLVAPGRCRRTQPQYENETYSKHSVSIPGSEIVSVWRSIKQ